MVEMIQKNDRWQELVKSERFDEEKAKLSLMTQADNFPKNIQANKIEDIFKTETPTISTVRLYRGELITRALVWVLLKPVIDAFNVSEELTKTQKDMITEFVCTDFYFVTVAELKLCFRNAIKGAYGKIYNRIDVNTVISWINQFLEEKRGFVMPITDEERETNIKKIYTNETKKATDLLLRKLKVNEVERKYSKFESYKNIESYCSELNLNYEETAKSLEDKCISEYKSDALNENIRYELFAAMWMQKFLLEARENQNNKINV